MGSRGMAKQRSACGYAVAAAVAVIAISLGGCGGGSLNLNPTEWFSGSGSSSSSSGSSGADGGFTTFRGSVEAPTRAVSASDLVGADGRCEGGSSDTAPRGVGLTMTECELVTLAGTPDQVNIGADEGGARRTVLNYGKGNNAGIYTFLSGRLKIIERLPTPDKPEPRRRAPKPQRA